MRLALRSPVQYPGQTAGTAAKLHGHVILGGNHVYAFFLQLTGNPLVTLWHDHGLVIQVETVVRLGSDQAMLLRFIGYPSKNRCFQVLKRHFQG